MKNTTVGALAVTAVTLAGCSDFNEVLTTAEKQEKLDTVFAEIGALPQSTQDRFQEFSDPDGDCAVAYKDSERGVVQQIALTSHAYPQEYPMPQMVRVDCDDLQHAFHKARTTLALDQYDLRLLSGEDAINEHYETSMKEYEIFIADISREGKVPGSQELLNIETFGLK